MRHKSHDKHPCSELCVCVCVCAPWQPANPHIDGNKNEKRLQRYKLENWQLIKHHFVTLLMFIMLSVGGCCSMRAI